MCVTGVTLNINPMVISNDEGDLVLQSMSQSSGTLQQQLLVTASLCKPTAGQTHFRNK